MFIYNSVAKALTGEVGNNNWFFGGSRRFGYNNRNSDYDFFVCPQCPGTFFGFLLDNSFSRVTNSKYYNCTNNLWGYKNLIHILIISNFKEFNNLRNEHENVQNMLESNKTLLQFVRATRSTVSGSAIYKFLVSCLPGDHERWYLNGRLHRKDGPAVEYANDPPD